MFRHFKDATGATYTLDIAQLDMEVERIRLAQVPVSGEAEGELVYPTVDPLDVVRGLTHPTVVEITREEMLALTAPPPLTVEQLNAIADAQRAAAYRDEADPLFFKYQRGEATKEAWLASIDSIKSRFPKVE